ncbi:hypothetical protein J3R82DRAFT_10217 [Butyriboletus roseoflavus]|nr:hypothetical protein J3R82DRAFT_10217 [Butyriboletus roseoflavus]
MHLALYLPEILYNIFGHVAPVENWEWAQERLPHTSDLAALARTCQAFKEPALDVLWSELPDLSALARCVPDATHSEKRCHYAFKRPLTDVEWATLRSYARRVWIFLNCILMEACLDEESITMLFSPSPDALFPNLRFLSWNYGRPFPLVHVAARPLRVLHLDFRRADTSQYRNILDSAGNLCPHIKKFRTLLASPILFGSWSVARSPSTRRPFYTSPACRILPSDFVLVFSNLSRCEIASGWLFPGSPSKQTLRSFITSLGNACSSDTLTHLTILSQHYLFRRLLAGGEVESDNYPLVYDDLYPCMTFGNLRSLKINLNQAVGLTDNDLVELASAWPHLEELLINH